MEGKKLLSQMIEEWTILAILQRRDHTTMELSHGKVIDLQLVQAVVVSVFSLLVSLFTLVVIVSFPLHPLQKIYDYTHKCYTKSTKSQETIPGMPQVIVLGNDIPEVTVPDMPKQKKHVKSKIKLRNKKTCQSRALRLDSLHHQDEARTNYSLS